MVDVLDHRSLIEERLSVYLMNDKEGMRRSMLQILLERGECTTKELHELLTEAGFEKTYRGICAILGSMNSKLGLLTITTRSRSRIYQMKPECRDVVRYVMENYQSSGSEFD
ncbi:MAG: DUF2551 domain-containing protein [Candidatus Syntropharchaeales archaeon]